MKAAHLPHSKAVTGRRRGRSRWRVILLEIGDKPQLAGNVQVIFSDVLYTADMQFLAFSHQLIYFQLYLFAAAVLSACRWNMVRGPTNEASDIDLYFLLRFTMKMIPSFMYIFTIKAGKNWYSIDFVVFEQFLDVNFSIPVSGRPRQQQVGMFVSRLIVIIMHSIALRILK